MYSRLFAQNSVRGYFCSCLSLLFVCFLGHSHAYTHHPCTSHLTHVTLYQETSWHGPASVHPAPGSPACHSPAAPAGCACRSRKSPRAPQCRASRRRGGLVGGGRAPAAGPAVHVYVYVCIRVRLGLVGFIHFNGSSHTQNTAHQSTDRAQQPHLGGEEAEERDGGHRDRLAPHAQRLGRLVQKREGAPAGGSCPCCGGARGRGGRRGRRWILDATPLHGVGRPVEGPPAAARIAAAAAAAGVGAAAAAAAAPGAMQPPHPPLLRSSTAAAAAAAAAATAATGPDGARVVVRHDLATDNHNWMQRQMRREGGRVCWISSVDFDRSID
jgi:hypothetical protein